MRQRMTPPRSLKWQQGLRCRCSPSATSGKDAARDPPSFSSSSSYVVTGLAQSNHRRGDVGEKQARAPGASRLLRSSSILDFFFLTRCSSRGDEGAPVAPPGPLHPESPPGQESAVRRLSVRLLRHSGQQQGTIRAPATPRSVLAAPRT